MEHKVMDRNIRVETIFGDSKCKSTIRTTRKIVEI